MNALYHYTTGAGLLGMLKNYSSDNQYLTMWATHYMYMNDPGEYIYGYDFCVNIIDDIENDLGVNKNNRIKKIVSSADYQTALRIVKRHPDNHVLCPYLTSFSRAEDSLHMWNMYATNGNGIAIKFHEEKLIRAYINTKDCLYYKDGDVYLYNKIKQQILDYYTELNSEVDKCKTLTTEIKRAHYISSLICLFIGIRIKNAAYELEREARITPNITNKEILFRKRNGMIIPYVEHLIPFDSIESITVGPTADFNCIRESILILLNHKGIQWDEDRIIKSTVPYRI